MPDSIPKATQPTAPMAQPWILVVDDDPSMRLMIETTLSVEGLAVTSADGAEEALEILKANQAPPAVLVCDVLMPGIDGLEFVRNICARVPDLNVIFISGRLSDVSWWPEDLREKRFVQKPFERRQLVGAVKAAMEGRPRR
jgi:DNA-binding NtrC family response regulator